MSKDILFFCKFHDWLKTQHQTDVRSTNFIAPHGESLCREEVEEREKPSKTFRYNNLWSPVCSTVVHLGTVAIGLTIIEMPEEVETRYINGEYVREKDYVPPNRGKHAFDRTWTTTKNFPAGRLCSQVYSPYPMAKWKKQWQETTTRGLDRQSKRTTFIERGSFTSLLSSEFLPF